MRAGALLMLALAAALAAGPAAAQGELGDILPGTIRSAVGDLAALREIDAIDQLVADVKTACKTLKGYDRPALRAYYQGLMSAQEEAAKRSLLAQEDQTLYYERRRAEYVRYYVNAMMPCVLQRIDELNAPEPTIAGKPTAAGAAKSAPAAAAAKLPAAPPPVAAKPPANPPVEIASTAPASSAPAETAAAKSPAPPPAAPAAASPPASPPASSPVVPAESVAPSPPVAAKPPAPAKPAASPPAASTETAATPAVPATPPEVAAAPASLPAAAPAAPEAGAAPPNAEPAAEPLPDKITVTDYNVKNGTATIVLSKVKDNIYEGTWDKGEFKSRVTVTAFAPNRLVMRRQDFGGDGVGKGMTYAGKRDGNSVQATGYRFPDPLGLGTWEAKW